MINYKRLSEATNIYDICKLFYNEHNKSRLAKYWPESPESILSKRKIILFGAGEFGERIIENL